MGRLGRWEGWTMVLMATTTSLVAEAQSDPGDGLSQPAPDRPREPRSVVEEVYRQGAKALRRRDVDQAREAFARGLKIAAPGAGRFRMLLGMALALELAGEPAGAWLHYRAFIAASAAHPDGDLEEWRERRARAERDVTELEARLDQSHARVTIVSRPANAAVIVDGTRLPEEIHTPTTAFLEPGSHRVEVELPDGIDATEVEVVAGRRYEVVATPEPPEVAVAEEVPSKPRPMTPEPPAPSVPPSPDMVDEGPDMALLGVGASSLGLGATAIVAAGILTGLATESARDLDALAGQPITNASLAQDASFREELGFRQGMAAGLYAGGAALLAAGGIVVWLAWKDDRAVAWRVGPRRLMFEGRF